MGISFPNESELYRSARDRLLQNEIELRRATEAVAEERRALPPGGEIPEDYTFDGADRTGAATPVRMSELFSPGKDTLVIYSFMYPRGPGDDRPCPSCTGILDPLDGAAEHVSQRVGFAVVAKTALPNILAHADDRGWRHLRLLSSASNSYNLDYFAEDPDSGQQQPMMNVFRRDGNTLRHFWGTEPMFADPDPGQDPRHNGTLDMIWNVFDLTPDGRGTDWREQLSYPSTEHVGAPS